MTRTVRGDCCDVFGCGRGIYCARLRAISSFNNTDDESDPGVSGPGLENRGNTQDGDVTSGVRPGEFVRELKKIR